MSGIAAWRRPEGWAATEISFDNLKINAWEAVGAEYTVTYGNSTEYLCESSGAKSSSVYPAGS